MRVLCWIFAIITAGVGAFIIFDGLESARSAPQEAVVISLGIAVAVISYCFARACTEIGNLCSKDEQLAELLAVAKKSDARLEALEAKLASDGPAKVAEAVPELA